jgi:hypothetical protein
MMLRSSLVLAFALAGCVTHTSAPPVIVTGPSGGEVVEGAVPGGAELSCSPGSVCNYECAQGGCSMGCAEGSVCNLDCSGGGCNFACAEGATCNVDCSGGGCTPACADGSICNVDE